MILWTSKYTTCHYYIRIRDINIIIIKILLELILKCPLCHNNIEHICYHCTYFIISCLSDEKKICNNNYYETCVLHIVMRDLLLIFLI